MARPRWTLAEVSRFKIAIKTELDQKNPAEKMPYILGRITELNHSQSAADGLQLFVFAMSALAQHERSGGLHPSQIRDLINLAETTLKVFQIAPQTSRLAFLYGELSMMASQIYLKDGFFWKATWEQYVAMHLSGDALPGGKAYVDLLFGIKFLRLGHGARALDFFKDAEALGGAGDVWRLARIHRIRTLRLTGKHQEALQLIRATSHQHDNEDLQRELDWEMACCGIQETQKLDLLHELVQKGSSHYQASYVLEFYFWALAVPTTQWLSKTSRIRTLVRDEELGLKDSSFYYGIARDLERAYDEKLNLTHRLQTLGGILEKLPQCHSVDRQLLILAAVGRWLLRKKIKDLFEVTLLEYRSLCQKMSQGHSSDLLGLFEDASFK